MLLTNIILLFKILIKIFVDYFDKLYEFAVILIKRGLAYVDCQTGEQIHLERGGDNGGARKESPYRNKLDFTCASKRL